VLHAFKVARRELRGGLKGFRIFLACLALGVTSIAAVGSLSNTILKSLESNGAILLGGDISLRMTHQDITEKQREWITKTGSISRVVYLRSMARSTQANRRSLVEIKFVDSAYPLYGKLKTTPTLPIQKILEEQDGVWGIAADPNLFKKLKVKLGDRIGIGNLTYEIRAKIDNEPDRISGARALKMGPRIIASTGSLGENGLLKPGSQVWFFYRLRLKTNTDVEILKEKLQKDFPDAQWIVRDRRNASPTIKRFIDSTTLFLTLAGLTTLLIGGIGVSNAISNFLSGKLGTIATLKSIGAPNSLIFTTYLVQVGLMAIVGIAIGLIIGTLIPSLLSESLSNIFPVKTPFQIYWEPLLIAANLGILTTLIFSLWPIARACKVRPAILFRSTNSQLQGTPGFAVMLFIMAAIILLITNVVLISDNKAIASWFMIGIIASMLFFRILAYFLIFGAKYAGSFSKGGLRLVFSNLHRPGASTKTVILSLGIGLTLFVSVALIEFNLSKQLTSSLPNRAPNYFFVDIQNHQLNSFNKKITTIKGVREFRHTPMLRGRVTRLNGAQIKPENVSTNGRWILRGDRGITWSRVQPKHEQIIAGKWWNLDYSGPPLVSMSKTSANALGLKLNDTITLNVLGRNIKARIVNFRKINWRTLGMNFIFIFSPSPLQFAPQTLLATVHTDPDSEERIEEVISSYFPNVTSIRVRDVLETVQTFLEKTGFAIKLIAAAAILGGIIVLAGAIAAGQKRRIYDAIVLKVIGASRKKITYTLLAEFCILGIVTAFVAIIIGTTAAWIIVKHVMEFDFMFNLVSAASSCVLALALTIGLGLQSTWWALNQKAAPLLKND
tara:strand:+ start:4143 stop:6662 length:2520 start_codon:yes stop_codon:yes gene_type:complete